MSPNSVRKRRAGVLLPLFSCPSTRSWGVGAILDIEPAIQWLAGAGQRVLQLLPLNEMAPGQQSPYSAISAMAIDPIFISLADVPEFSAIGGEACLDQENAKTLARVRASTHVDHRGVRQLKDSVLAQCFERFLAVEWSRDTDRARAMQAFLAAERWWIDEYAVFRAIHSDAGERPWTEWEQPLQEREARAMDDVRRRLAQPILFWQYLQWLAHKQWQRVRKSAQASGVQLFGDLTFMVDRDSADVWSRQSQFRLNASLGVPPDAFSATGQDWGMPPYNWDAVAATDFEWLRHRARRNADLYDGYRVDHLVGFYRTYARPRDGGEPFFSPSAEPDQVALGEHVLSIFREPGAEIIAEDLGTVPDYVRESLARLGVPGFKVFRWERFWNDEGQPFRDPAEYPEISVAASGTHDTEPMPVWWDEAPSDDRAKVNALPTIQRLAGGAPLADRFDAHVRDVLIESLFASRSELIINPLQDVFGWRDRINTPARVDETNWTFRLPWPIDAAERDPEARDRQQALRLWAERHGRL